MTQCGAAFLPQVIGFLVAFIAGMGLAAQATINAALAIPLQTGLASSTTSFLVGAIALCVFAPLSFGAQKSDPTARGELHWWMWVTPPACGVYYVTLSIFLGPQLGYSMFFVSVICGQVMFGMIIDHYAWLDIPKSAITNPKLVSVAVVVAGCVLAVVERIDTDTDLIRMLLFMLLSILSGGAICTSICIQGAFTNRYGTLPHRTAGFSFGFGFLMIATIWGISVAVDPDLADLDLRRTEWWMYTGGLLGANYVACCVALGPLLGMALLTMATVGGQLFMSVLIDGLGLFQSPVLGVSWLRLVGVMLVLFGGIAFRYASIKARDLAMAASAELHASQKKIGSTATTAIMVTTVTTAAVQSASDRDQSEQTTPNQQFEKALEGQEPQNELEQQRSHIISALYSAPLQKSIN